MVAETKDLILRDGVREDAVHLTQVVHLASEGMALAMWTDIAGPDGDPWQVGRARASRDEGAFSWRNARVCERNGAFAGALIGYPIGADPEEIGDDMPDVFRPLVELENQALETFYVNVLATLDGHRRRGAARRLIEDAAERADGSDLSLIVASGNAEARSFYTSLNFFELATAHASPGFGWTPSSPDWILMRRTT